MLARLRFRSNRIRVVGSTGGNDWLCLLDAASDSNCWFFCPHSRTATSDGREEEEELNVRIIK